MVFNEFRNDKLSVGETVIELTNPAPPCKTIKDSFKDGKFNRNIRKEKILVFQDGMQE